MDPLTLLAAFGAGILAGLGAVVPLGAIGVMLLNEGAQRGWRAGAPAAAGVGIADTLYCILALAAGSALAPVVSEWGRWPAAVGGLLLIVVAVLMLRKAARGPATAEDDGARSAGSSGWARFALFFTLTAVNPFPLVYFGAIAVGLGENLHQRPVAAVFAIAVGLASIGWNLVLVAAGAALRAKSTVRMQRIVSAVGGGIVAICGVAVILTAFL